MKWLREIVESGVPPDGSVNEQRPVALSNYISMILIGISVFNFILLPHNHNIGAFREALIAIGVFSVPLALNYFKHYTFARLYLSWAPPIQATWFMLGSMQISGIVAIDTVEGLKLYLLAYSCIPYLILPRSNIFVFLLGIAPCSICLFFPDLVIELFDTTVESGSNRVPVLTLLRSLIAYVVINGGCLTLRVLFEKGERENRKLIEEVRLKNTLILEESANEVTQLNAQLRMNLQEVSEREFILNQSQKIAKVGSWEYRVKDQFVFLSDEMYNIFGIRKDADFHISNLDVILGKPQRQVLGSMNADLLRTGRPYELTLSFTTPLQSRKWVKVYAFPIYENATIAGVRGICHDITIYKVSEDQIRKSEQKYRSLFEQASDAIVVMDVAGRIIDVNERVPMLTGHPREELLQLNAADLLTGFSPTELKLVFNRLASGEKVFSEGTLKHKDGSIVEIEANAKLFNENQIMSIVRDVSERRRNERELIISQANLNSTINNTEILICSIDREFNLITFNKPFFNHIKNHFNVEVKPGTHIFMYDDRPEYVEFKDRWRKLFMRSLSGEIVNFEETQNGRDIQYSLNPIIEANQIIGVSIFAEDVSERKRYIRELAETNRQLAETRLMALRSVMSPHFIFNVLSSIQFYITRSERENAIRYLSIFSKLIRSVLNQSVNSKVKLSEEIESLKNYVELESSRFEDMFDFILDTERLADDDMEIPSLLIQPYVENAILHGLYNKKSPGTLWLRFISEDGGLVVEVEDNGIGREEALRIKQSGVVRNNSMGLKLTEERLRLINQYKHTSFEVFDLKDQCGNATGTKVKVTIANV